jgi:hypothetical protein
VANQKELFGEGFKGDKTFLLIILLAKWVYQLVFFITLSKETKFSIFFSILNKWRWQNLKH